MTPPGPEQPLDRAPSADAESGPAPDPDADEPVVLGVPDALEGERLDRAVAFLTGWSRAEVQTLLERSAVRVDGRSVSKSHRLRAGAVLELLDSPRPAAPPSAEPVPVEVRYEDAHLIVVAKPAGLVVHPGPGHEHGTLVHGLLARYPEIATVGAPDRPGIVHRLDRDTSGLLVVARSAEAYVGLVGALAAREVERVYDALVWGEPDAPRGVIDAPLGRSATHRTRMAVRTAGKEARTRYEVVRVLRWRAEPGATGRVVSLLECRLETGRTHQIRVHLAAIGHPVVGDRVYGGARPGPLLDRPFLHAARLAFTHPVTGEPLAFTEPRPPELEAVLAALESV